MMPASTSSDLLPEYRRARPIPLPPGAFDVLRARMIQLREFWLQLGLQMRLTCEQCGKEGTLDEHDYSGKKLKVRCPYCSHDFIFSVPPDETVDTVAEGESIPRSPFPLADPLVPQANARADEAAIREAKRIARLIISEIKLYNHERIERAQSKREVLELLKTDLTRGKQHYASRVAAKLPSGPDYFSESINEILLAGKN